MKQSKAGTRVSASQPDQSGRDEMHSSTYISGGMWTRCFRHPGQAWRRRECCSVPALHRHPCGHPCFSTCHSTPDTGVHASTAELSVVERRKVLESKTEDSAVLQSSDKSAETRCTLSLGGCKRQSLAEVLSQLPFRSQNQNLSIILISGIGN
ncbi:hypothetical protein D4764_18G0010660 [Takifugu flavidus]|uniref:Uncharacterized protein n=1 Tax=Takifugu flavidus TaxID=433684 RepID=A0A5C6NW64_9TELE|nr:hypothetical protein D4764_18G0010660 [Takifugu flavidus]